MKFKLLIDPLAKQDMIDIFNYVSINDSPDNATKLLNNLDKTCLQLEKLPTRGHIPEELKNTGIKRFLEIHYKLYRIIYEIFDNVVYIHCIFDGRRSAQEFLHHRLFR